MSGDADPCPNGPHRFPDGPCEDIAQCPKCWAPTFAMRPPGECYGHHAPDCSLPERHERRCVGGGSGHPTRILRGYPEFTWTSSTPSGEAAEPTPQAADDREGGAS